MIEMADLAPVVQWVSAIASPIIIAAGTAKINSLMKQSEEKTDAKRRAEAEWRERIEKKMEEQDGKIDAVLAAQCTQMRSDCVHRAHRYIDDLGCASVEEKQSFWAEYEEYCIICEKYGIENHFVEQMARQVMALPERPAKND